MKLSDKFKTYRNWDDFEGYIRPKNTDQVVITDDGKVGIGTNNPTAKIDLASGQGVKLKIYEDGGGDNKSGLGTDISGENYELSIFFGSHPAGHLSIGTYDGNTFVQKFRVNADGKFYAGDYSVASSGYTYLPNGLILQWRKLEGNVPSGTYTFPIAFSTAVLSVQASHNNRGSYDIGVQDVTLTSCYINGNRQGYSNDNTLMDVWILAVGY